MKTIRPAEVGGKEEHVLRKHLLLAGCYNPVAHQLMQVQMKYLLSLGKKQVISYCGLDYDMEVCYQNHHRRWYHHHSSSA